MTDETQTQGEGAVQAVQTMKKKKAYGILNAIDYDMARDLSLADLRFLEERGLIKMRTVDDFMTIRKQINRDYARFKKDYD